MRLIDEQYLLTPFYGIGKMTFFLRQQGYQVNVKRTRRLMRLMGLEAVYPRPDLSAPDPAHGKYPYLLKGLYIGQPNQVWCSDITYIPMQKGFMYLVAVMDWYSRYVLAWELSNSMESSFCLHALDKALCKGRPVIFNTDQGAQFTSLDFTEKLSGEGISISMDGKGRYQDNIFIERLWRSLKWECIYLHSFEDGQQLWKGLESYFHFYNNQRFHQSFDYLTPAQIYSGKPVKEKCN